MVNQILTSPTASYWLRKTLKAALQRDPVDALNDAKTLVKALEKEVEIVQSMPDCPLCGEKVEWVDSLICDACRWDA